MTFKNAVEKTPGLENAYRTGLQALRTKDRSHIDPENTRNLTGSVDIDAALLKSEPNANRWDFAVAYKHKNRDQEVVYWLEMHTANDSQIKVVIKKAIWLRKWLQGAGKLLAQFEREIAWISSGTTSFTLSAPQRKQMAQVGLRHAGSRLSIPEVRR